MEEEYDYYHVKLPSKEQLEDMVKDFKDRSKSLDWHDIFKGLAESVYLAWLIKGAQEDGFDECFDDHIDFIKREVNKFLFEIIVSNTTKH